MTTTVIYDDSKSRGVSNVPGYDAGQTSPAVQEVAGTDLPEAVGVPGATEAPAGTVSDILTVVEPGPSVQEQIGIMRSIGIRGEV